MWWNFVGRTHEDIVKARDDWAKAKDSVFAGLLLKGEAVFLHQQGCLASRPAGSSSTTRTGAHVLPGGRGQKRLYHRHIKANPHVVVVVDDLPSTDPWTPRGITVRGRADRPPTSRLQAGENVTIAVTVQGSAAGGNLKSLSVYVAYDGGRSWTKTAVTGGKVTVNNAADVDQDPVIGRLAGEAGAAGTERQRQSVSGARP